MEAPDFRPWEVPGGGLDDGFAEQLLLAWAGRRSSFALHAASVGRIVEESEWLGDGVRDLTEVLELDDTLEPVRILDVRVGLAGAARLGLRTFGAMRLCRVAPADLLDVPPLLRARGAGRFVRQMAVIDGAPALWVLDAHAILRGAGERRSTSLGAAEGAPLSMRGSR